MFKILRSQEFLKYSSYTRKEEKRIAGYIYVLVFGKFPCGKRREIETATKRNILCYCLSLFCKDFMLFKEAKRVKLKRCNN
jgi:hypothetical protein